MAENFALVIAVEKYLDRRIRTVRYAENDAQGFYEALKLHGFHEKNVKILLSSSATKTTIESKLRRIISNLHSDDHFIFFYAGHGFAESDHNYITCYDTQRGDLILTSIALKTIIKAINESQCLQAMMFLDSCHSGLKFDENMRGMFSHLSEEELEEFFRSSEYHIGFASCKSDQVSYGSPEISHGIWSYHIIEAMTGNAEITLEKGAFLTANSLQNYLADAVPRTLRETTTGAHIQTPCMFGNFTKDFIVANLKPILEAKKASVEPKIAQLKQIMFSGRVSGRIKTLSGFKKFHTVPREVNERTEQFVAGIGTKELEEATETLINKIKRQLSYKRRDINIKSSEGAAEIICKDFDVTVTLCQELSDPAEYLLKTEVYNIRNPLIVETPDFDNAFKDTFDSLIFEFDEQIDIKKIIDRIEDVDNENIEVEYPGDCSSCNILIKGFDADIMINDWGLTILRNKKTDPLQLVGYFFETQILLVNTYSIKELSMGK